MCSHSKTILDNFGFQEYLEQQGYTFSYRRVGCSVIGRSENVTLLSSKMIYGTMAISKSVICIIRDAHFFTSYLCNQYECQSIARRVRYFRVVIRYCYLPLGRNTLHNIEKIGKINQEHNLNIIHIYINVFFQIDIVI